MRPAPARPRRDAGKRPRFSVVGEPGAACGHGLDISTGAPALLLPPPPPPAVGITQAPRLGTSVTRTPVVRATGSALASQSTSGTTRSTNDAEDSSEDSSDDGGLFDMRELGKADAKAAERRAADLDAAKLPESSDDDEGKVPEAQEDVTSSAGAGREGRKGKGKGRREEPDEEDSGLKEVVLQTRHPLQASVDKAMGRVYSRWATVLLQRVCHLRGIKKMSTVKNREKLVGALLGVDEEKGRGGKPYVDDLHLLLVDRRAASPPVAAATIPTGVITAARAALNSGGTIPAEPKFAGVSYSREAILAFIMPTITNLVQQNSSARDSLRESESASAKLHLSSDLRSSYTTLKADLAAERKKPEVDEWYVEHLEKKLHKVKEAMEKDAEAEL